MKIGKILAMAAVATVFASCSNEEELANVGKSESNAIRFAGISGLSDTRPHRLAHITLPQPTSM